jgi:hypothetical protein
MANRRFEMYHYRQALVRMRQGESDRQIHATGLMGGVPSVRYASRHSSGAGLIPPGPCHQTRSWRASFSVQSQDGSVYVRAWSRTAG